MTLEAATSQRELRDIRFRQARFTRRCAFCRREQREAMFQISTAFAVRSTTIADSDGPRPERLAALQQWRDDIDALYAGPSACATAGLRPVGLENSICSARIFLAIVDGMEMDCAAGYPGAGSCNARSVLRPRGRARVGRLSVRVFGVWRGTTASCSRTILAVRWQFTNILRDIDEDAAIGRLYLPREGLLHTGITNVDPLKVTSDPALAESVRAVGRAGADAFSEADEVMSRNPRRLVRAPRIMSRYYRAILELLVARGFAPPRAPVRLNKMARIAILLRYAFI